MHSRVALVFSLIYLTLTLPFLFLHPALCVLMERKDMVKGSAARSNPRRGRKNLGTSVPKTKRVVEPKRVEVKSAPVSFDSSSSYSTDEDYAEFLKTYNPQESHSSSSDEIDADYAEFLKTYNPQEVYPRVSSSDEGKSDIAEGSGREETSRPSKEVSDSD
jgi:hypothetical protein